MHQVIDRDVSFIYSCIFILLYSKRSDLINIVSEEHFKIYISDIKAKGKELQKKNRRVENKSSVY